MSKIDLILDSYIEKISENNIKDRYVNLYKNDYSEKYIKIFSYFHQKLNDLFTFMNSKNESNKHFNAWESRDLLFIINSIDDLNLDLNTYWEEIIIKKEYQDLLKIMRTFLSSSWWSGIPNDFERIQIINYEPIFSTNNKKIILNNKIENADLKIIWEWAFSKVSKYKDSTYDKFFAIKTLKKNFTDRELERFKKEFEILKKLSFPYILEVYNYDDWKNNYTMEFCDMTLLKYIQSNNSKLPFITRKRIALQFLYAINYLHSKNIYHRDISYWNVLIKKFDWAVMIKLSDFGLVKEELSNFTKIDTEIKWTIIDPSLDSFKNYSIKNEIYSIWYI